MQDNLLVGASEDVVVHVVGLEVAFIRKRNMLEVAIGASGCKCHYREKGCRRCLSGSWRPWPVKKAHGPLEKRVSA